MQMFLDNRKGVQNAETCLENPTMEDAIRCIEKLDGEQHTLVSLEHQNETTVWIGGGPEHFVVTKTERDNKNYTLMNPDNKESKAVLICAGGQFGDYAADAVVSKFMVQELIRDVFGKKVDRLKWREDL